MGVRDEIPAAQEVGASMQEKTVRQYVVAEEVVSPIVQVATAAKKEVARVQEAMPAQTQVRRISIVAQNEVVRRVQPATEVQVQEMDQFDGLELGHQAECMLPTLDQGAEYCEGQKLNLPSCSHRKEISCSRYPESENSVEAVSRRTEDSGTGEAVKVVNRIVHVRVHWEQRPQAELQRLLLLDYRICQWSGKTECCAVLASLRAISAP